MATNPSILTAVEDVNSTTIALTGNKRTLIRYRSNAYASMDITAYGGASINEDMCIIRNGSNTVYGRAGTFNNVENATFRFSAEDSNGNIGTATRTVDMIPYVELTCYMENNKPDTDGNMTVECSGDYYNGSFGARSNTLSVSYRYSKNGGSFGSWRSMTVSRSGNSYTAYANLSGLDYQASYSFEIQAEDELTITSSSAAGVSSLPVFHWSKEDFVFEVPVTFNGGVEGLDNSNVDGDMTVTGNLRLQGDGETYGNRLLFGDEEYCYIGEETDDSMTLHAGNKIIFDADSYECTGAYDIPQYGLWTPELDDSAVNYYSTRRGWYSRVGYVVTVGFYIKASCSSGYEDDDVVISGLPFTPSYSASGGGICSGAFIPSGRTFQCFVAEDGTYEITVRVQECDREYDENLGTSASGCGYPETGGTLTLSGTITYMSEEW